MHFLSMLCRLKYKIVRKKNIEPISFGKVEESSFSYWSVSLLVFCFCCFQTVLQMNQLLCVCYKNAMFPPAATGHRLKFGSINPKTVPKLPVSWDCF